MRRVGSLREHRVNVRLITATNRNLTEEVRAGRFREDLYYRINTVAIEMPPLRERHGDIRQFVEKFLGPGWEIAPDAMEKLETYRWPGNIRQLINVIERAKILADDQVAEIPPLLTAVVGLEALLARPIAHDRANVVAERGRQVALLEVEHIVPAPGPVQP